jgi:hypothetical protein
MYSSSFFRNLIFSSNLSLYPTLSPSSISIIDIYDNSILNSYSDYEFLSWLTSYFDSLGLFENINWSLTLFPLPASLNLLDAATVLAYYDGHDEYYGHINPAPSSILFDFKVGFWQDHLDSNQLIIPAPGISISYFNLAAGQPGKISWLYTWVNGVPVFMRAYTGTHYLYCAHYPSTFNFYLHNYATRDPLYPEVNLFPKASSLDVSITAIEKITGSPYSWSLFKIIVNNDQLVKFTNASSSTAGVRVFIGNTLIQIVPDSQSRTVFLKNKAPYLLKIGYY